jgi:hypothetical protein
VASRGNGLTGPFPDPRHSSSSQFGNGLRRRRHDREGCSVRLRAAVRDQAGPRTVSTGWTHALRRPRPDVTEIATLDHVPQFDFTSGVVWHEVQSRNALTSGDGAGKGNGAMT